MENAGTDVARAAALLKNGGVAAFPTETVYGLGANALDPRAVARIFEIKGRPRFDPLIVHLADIGEVSKYAREFPEAARRLTDRFWPGPLTLVLPKKEVIPDLVTAGLPTVALRVPKHPLALELIRTAGVPIAAPSANRFGGISPTTADHVRQELGDAVDFILDGGPCQAGVESTVISFVHDPPALLRPGALPVEEIEAIIGPIPRLTEAGPVLAPGMLQRHYAPRTPLVIAGTNPVETAPRRVGLLRISGDTMEEGYAVVEVLSSKRDLREAAANLFAALRRLDTLGLDRIVAELAPEHGLGLAINDRLRRASAAG